MRRLISESKSNSSSPAAKHSAMEPLQDDLLVGIHERFWGWSPLARTEADEPINKIEAQIRRRNETQHSLAIVSQ